MPLGEGGGSGSGGQRKNGGSLSMAPLSKQRRNGLWWIRLLLVGIWFIVSTALHFALCLVRGRNSANNLLYLKILVPVCRRILGVKVIPVTAAQPDPRPCVYIMNHQSAFDILVNMEVYPPHCVVVVKKSLAKIPVFGWIVSLGDNVFIDRANRTASVQQLQETRQFLSHRQKSVWIFPEGTRNRAGRMSAFKRGAFHLAIQAQVPLVPVVASRYAGVLDFSRWKAGTVVIEKGEPINTTALGEADLENLIQRCQTEMERMLDVLTRKALFGEPAAQPTSRNAETRIP